MFIENRGGSGEREGEEEEGQEEEDKEEEQKEEGSRLSIKLRLCP